MFTFPPPPWRLRPVCGTCAWVDRERNLVKINRVVYKVVVLPSGLRLTNQQTGNSYDIDAQPQSCTCPSFVWDHCPIQAGGDGRCKHIAALRKLGLLPTPIPQGKPTEQSAAA